MFLGLMQHTFSAEFLKILPPSSNFGEAWEALCVELLFAESPHDQITSLSPPDRGVDILNRTTGVAYQCKSTARGTLGTIDAEECVSSLRRASDAQAPLGWSIYCFAMNAPISGVGLGKINIIADELNVPRPGILGPEHWSKLCEKHRSLIEKFFDYRVFVTEMDVKVALEKARYYEEHINSSMATIKSAPTLVQVSNNRTPIKLQIPFSAELTIEKLLDVTQEILGISLKSVNFSDLGTSFRTSLSMTVDGVSIPFKKKLSEMSEAELSHLQFWIQLIWRDKPSESDDSVESQRMLRFLTLDSFKSIEKAWTSEQDRRRETLSRAERLIQMVILSSVNNIRQKTDIEDGGD